MLRQSSLACALALLLASCGGGGGTSTLGPDAGTLTLSGVVIDGPIAGARVFLDLNNNLLHDEGEPISEETGADGAFVLTTSALTATQLATAMLVSEIPATARDADDGGLTLAEAGKQAFTLLSPAKAFVAVQSAGTNTAAPVVISPLTTLVAGEITSNGLTLTEAKETVKRQLVLASDPLDNFVQARDTGTAAIARAAAVALGEAKRAVADVAQKESGMAAREQVQAVVQTVRDSLPTVVSSLDLASPSTSTPSVSTLVTAMQGNDAVSGKAAGKAAKQTAIEGSGDASPQFTDYIVVFKDTVGNPAQAANDAAANRGNVRFTYERAIKGFAVRLPAAASEAFLEAMANNPNVDYVEADAPVSKRQTVQGSAPWGLDRIDQRDLPLSLTYSYSSSGSGVRAYVVDTGILAAHVDFGGRVATGHTVVADGNGTSDCNGHGTHVAGTIGGANYGVAKAVSLVPVRVLDCNGSGTLSGVIAGLDWVLADPARLGPAVVNMSLGGGASTSLDAAVAKVAASGVPVVVAAGNDNANACNYSPAREPSAITVGATTSADARASYSNYGSCLDVFAPGSGITSAWYTSTSATASLNGTSMATPHVTGLAALILQATPTATASQVSNQIKTLASTNKVASSGTGSPNLLLYSVTTTEVVAPAPAPALSVSVASLSGSATALRNGWQASVTITVKDASGALVAGANVAGSFTAGGASLTCTTAANGACTVKTGNLGKKTQETTYSVTGITGTGMTYAPAQNAMVSVKVTRP